MTTPVVQAFVERAIGRRRNRGAEGGRAVLRGARRQMLYEVYGADLSRDGLRASAILRRGMGFCVHKSIVYAAACGRSACRAGSC